MPRDWPTLQRIRVQKEKRLPDVLTIDEVRQLIGTVRKLRFRTYFATVYSLGLRRNEGLHLQVRDIDGARMLRCTSIVARAPRIASCHCLLAR